MTLKPQLPKPVAGQTGGYIELLDEDLRFIAEIEVVANEAAAVVRNREARITEIDSWGCTFWGLG